MKRYLILAGVLVAGIAHADLFDFEGEFATTDGGYTSLLMVGPTVTLEIYRDSGTGFDVFDTSPFVGSNFDFPASWGSQSLDPFFDAEVDDWFIGNFGTVAVSDSSDVSYVEIQMGDFGADSDTLILEAYDGLDATGNLLDSMVITDYTGNLDLDLVAETLSVSSSTGGIQSIRFRGGDEGTFYNSAYIDNIYVDSVPEPGTMVLVGLGALAAMRKRKSA